MRVGVYVDGYNLYYSGRGHCGRGTARLAGQGRATPDRQVA
jgi:hypothetical protein